MRASANFLIDAVAFVGFVFLAATGVLLHFVLPPGSGHFATLWGLDRHEWGMIHLWVAVALFAAMTLHLFLHWRWIVCVVRGRPKEGSGTRAGLAIVGVVALLGLAVSPFVSSVDQTGAPPHKLRTSEREATEDLGIQGAMTLGEVAQSTGVPIEKIVQALGLPADVSPDERLGRLRRTYGFEMDDVRKIVEERSQDK